MNATDLHEELIICRIEWNELGNTLDRTEEKIFDHLRNGEKERVVKHFHYLLDIENKMRPLRNNLMYVYENLAQTSQEKGKQHEVVHFKEKANEFYKNSYKRNERSLKLIGILNRNGIDVQKYLS